MPRRFRRRPVRAGLALLLVTLLVAARWFAHEERAPAPEALGEGLYELERVVDGDTLLLKNRARIRLQGIDTPETVQPNHPVEPWGPEATRFTQAFLSDGKMRLRFDRERRDRYGRFLAYVYVGDAMLNEELVRAGLATAELGFRYSDGMKRRFQRAQDEAQAAQRGIWSPAER